MIYVIEHLEPEVFPWCLIEYRSISGIVGKDNVWFTNIHDHARELSKLGRVFSESVRDLGLDQAKVCVLDPAATKTLQPSDGKLFEYCIFGGILGDYPPKQRTRVELTPFLPKSAVRNIGKEQFSTDNAVYVVHEILKGKPFDSLNFKDQIEIEIKYGEYVDLPYRYPLVNGKPRISDELVSYLKKKKSF